MKHLPLLLALLLAMPVGAAWNNDTEIQSLTRADPSAADDGVSLISSTAAPIRGYMLSVCAASGQTLSGAGYLRAWVYSALAAAWMRNTALDEQVNLSGKPCQAFPDRRPGYLKLRRVLYAADGITVSGGTTVTVRIERDSTL